ncbi:MAG: hypothetical protein OXE53_08260 [Deltaproteobacteria bacterium]|nr:hypothetical protein [Deltaproteobacteria bacterium]
MLASLPRSWSGQWRTSAWASSCSSSNTNDVWQIGGRKGGIEFYRVEGAKFRVDDRIFWTRNDARLGLVISRTAEVAAIRDGRVTFRLKDGRKLELDNANPQLRHLDYAGASTMHTFQGGSVNNLAAALEGIGEIWREALDRGLEASKERGWVVAFALRATTGLVCNRHTLYAPTRRK